MIWIVLALNIVTIDGLLIRDVIEQETMNQDMMGEDYDDPFEGMGQNPFDGMEQIFGMEGSENVLDLYQKLGEEIENMEDGDLEDDPTTVELMDKEDVEKKKAELLNKIKSFGLPTAPVDNLLGSAKGIKEDNASFENPENTASSPDDIESEARAEDNGGEAIVKGPNEIIDSGAKTQTVNSSGDDKKQKLKRTKAVNPLVRRRKKKTSKAKKAQEL